MVRVSRAARRAAAGCAAVLAAAVLAAVPARPAAAATWYEFWLPEAGVAQWCITSGTAPAAGDDVFLYKCYNKANQWWAQFSYGSGTYSFEYAIADAQGRALCLADPGGSGSDGKNFELWYCENIAAERFIPSYPGGGVTWRVDGTNETVADYGNRLVNYNAIITWHLVFGAPYEEWCPWAC